MKEEVIEMRHKMAQEMKALIKEAARETRYRMLLLQEHPDIFNRWVSEMREEMVEPRHKMLQEHPDIINRSASEQFCKMREEMVEMRHKMLRAYPDIINRSDKTEMKDEVIKMLQEHSDIINRSAIEPFCKMREEMVNRSHNTKCGITKTELGMRNFATWKGASRSEVPSFDCMRQLLHQLGMSSTGTLDVVRRRFKRNVRRDSVTFSNQQWQVRNVLTKCRINNRGTLEGGVQRNDEQLVAPNEFGSDPGSWDEQASVVKSSRHCGECKTSIDLVYRYLFSKVNQQTAHIGSSTYAEITRDGVSKIIKVILELKHNLTQGKASTFRAIDLGGGYLTCLAHIAQIIPGEYAAIEYCVDRTWAFANSYGKLLADGAEALSNTRIAYAYMNIVDLDWYDCDLVYAFDEAFPQAVWGKIVRTFVASPRCKLLITFKPAKATPGYKSWQRYMKDLGLMEACRLKLSKKGREGSNAMFMIRSKDHKFRASDTDWAKGKQFHGDMAFALQARHRSQQFKANPSNVFWYHSKKFWGDTTSAKKAVADLKVMAATIQSDAKKNRREKARRREVSDCGATYWEQCSSPCDTCDTTFSHLDDGELFSAKSGINGTGLFTKVPIAKGRMIKRFCGRSSCPRNRSDRFVLQLGGMWITPIGKHRFVNHSCEPNAAFQKWTDSKKGKEVVSIVALEDIAVGAEVCVSYGKEHDLASGILRCTCKASRCVSVLATAIRKRKRGREA